MNRQENNRARWLHGPSAQCLVPPEECQSPWRLVLLGAPGVGKGTQADLLHSRLGGCHLSTGDVFRAASSRSGCEHTPAMISAKEYMRRGELVPDATVWEMVRERTICLNCNGGFILDGFPRTLAQAETLKAHLEGLELSLSAVVDYELPLDEIISRLSGRRTCEQCKSIFHLTGQPPRIAGTCDHCSGRLFQREDDRPDAIKVRMAVYERSTAPLIRFYRDLGLLVSVPAIGSPDEICERTLVTLKRTVRKWEDHLALV